MLELDEKRTFEDEIEMEIFGFSSTSAYLEFRDLTKTIIKLTLSEIREHSTEVMVDKESYQQQIGYLEKFFLEKAEITLEEIKTEMTHTFEIRENPFHSSSDLKVTKDKLHQCYQYVEKLENELLLVFKTLEAFKMKKTEIEKFLHFIKENNVEEKLQSPLTTDGIQKLKNICNITNKHLIQISVFPKL